MMEWGGTLEGLNFQGEAPVKLYEWSGQAIYWVGSLEEVAFRCNTYLITDRDQAILVDPGSRAYFEQVKARVAQVFDPAKVTGMVLCHEDPDVCASMVDWLNLNPDMLVMTSPRTHVIVPHHGQREYRYYDVEQHPTYALPSGGELRFIPAPFLHFPGAITTYDTFSGFLFSGDIWGALDMNWELVVKDFETHVISMNLFNLEYMASNKATRGYVKSLAGLTIHAILPQHGSIIGPQHVKAALDYMANLQCGLDLLYPDYE
ncbi:MAG: MBL fold metallo-hydrolase [Nitrospirae bacterium]|nr:MAG: MBL fold metallo-hydrolase [Nitrospirota bacterium]